MYKNTDVVISLYQQHIEEMLQLCSKEKTVTLTMCYTLNNADLFAG